MNKDAFQRFEVDINLIRKYAKPGPRYTSYPTAPYFTPEIGSSDFLVSLADEKYRQRPLSLYFHIPFCDTMCYFCGCTMVVTHNRQRIRHYLHYLIKEMEIFSPLTRQRVVKQIHWGGGTPTHLNADEIMLLAEMTHRYYRIADDAEVSVEIDPRGMELEHFQALKKSGFNRISLGVQDFHLPTQRAVNRIQSEALTLQCVDTVWDLGFQSLNLDLIYGLPHQTPRTFADTIEKIIDIRPDRIALFNFAYIPWMKKHQRVIDEKDLPTPAQKLTILKHAVERLIEAGYVFIGMDHFALPEDSLSVALRQKTLYRNFQGYSTHANCDILAHGMSGISQTHDLYAQNTKDFSEYYASIDRQNPATERGYRLDADDQLRRTVIMRLMCDFSLDFARIEEEFGIAFDAYFSDALGQLDPFLLDGLLTIRDRRIEVTGMGRLLIRNIAMPFDKYLQKSNKATFSKTI